jgi:F0F1-type ATP synthase membrane subunit b/b'
LSFSWETVKDFIISFGWVKGTFTIFFWLALFFFYRLYKARIDDKQKEIDRLAQENREYRERFLALLDRHFDYQKPDLPVPRTRSQSNKLKKG